MINKLKFSIKRGYSLLKYKGKNTNVQFVGIVQIVFCLLAFYERLNSACPNCKSLVRHRHMWIFIKEMLEEQKNTPLKIIHFAPEKCLSSKLNNISNVEYFTSEYDKSKLEWISILILKKLIMKVIILIILFVLMFYRT